MSTNKTKVITGKVRFSYANVWEPKSIDGGEEKFSVSLIIPKSDTKTIDEIQSAIKVAEEEGKSKLEGEPLENLKRPLHDGDVERPEDEAYRGSYFVNANSKDAPQIVDENLEPILDQAQLYSGCYGRASITFYAFSQNGNKGIACGLGNLQKLEDGEPLSNRSTAEEDFADPYEAYDFLN